MSNLISILTLTIFCLDIGEHYRFLWVNLPVTRLPAPSDGIKCHISELLLGIYRRLENLPAISYSISPEARKVWTGWHNWCETQKLAEPHPSIRTLFPKARERAARIALVFHIVEAVANNQMPSQEISATTLNAAIQFVQWTIKQTRLLYADLGITEHQDSAKITRFVERFRYADWITPRMVRTWTAAREKPSSEQCRQFMQKIVDLGYAANNGQTGREFRIKILTCSHFSPLGTQTHTQYTSECSPLCSPDVVHFSPFHPINVSDNTNFPLNLVSDSSNDRVRTVTHEIDLSINSHSSVDSCNLPLEVDYMDYKWTTKWTTPKPSQEEDLNPKWTKWTTPISISVGDRVRYRGKGENGLFTIKGLKTDELTVIAISNDMVEVSNPRWVTTQNIPAQDLEKI